MDSWMSWLMQASDVQDLMYKLMLFLFVLAGLIVLVLVMVVWTFWNTCSPAQKTVIKVALVLAGLLYAIVAGWAVTQVLRQLGVPLSWDDWLTWATDKWMRFDGFTRSHRWLGAVGLALVPLLLWPGGPTIRRRKPKRASDN